MICIYIYIYIHTYMLLAAGSYLGRVRRAELLRLVSLLKFVLILLIVAYVYVVDDLFVRVGFIVSYLCLCMLIDVCVPPPMFYGTLVYSAVHGVTKPTLLRGRLRH